MDKAKISTVSFTDEDFFNLIKKDPKLIRQYASELVKLYSKTYTDEELISWYTSNAIIKPICDYTLAELTKLKQFVNFIRFVGDPDRYLKTMSQTGKNVQ